MLKEGEVISAIRSGGTLQVYGGKIVAEFKGGKAFEAGQKYLLFLTYVPEKGFNVADSISYLIKNHKIIKLTDQQLEPALESGNDAEPFISSVRAAAAASCEAVGGE